MTAVPITFQHFYVFLCTYEHAAYFKIASMNKATET